MNNRMSVARKFDGWCQQDLACSSYALAIFVPIYPELPVGCSLATYTPEQNDHFLLQQHCLKVMLLHVFGTAGLSTKHGSAAPRSAVLSQRRADKMKKINKKNCFSFFFFNFFVYIGLNIGN